MCVWKQSLCLREFRYLNGSLKLTRKAKLNVERCWCAKQWPMHPFFREKLLFRFSHNSKSTFRNFSISTPPVAKPQIFFRAWAKMRVCIARNFYAEKHARFEICWCKSEDRCIFSDKKCNADSAFSHILTCASEWSYAFGSKVIVSKHTQDYVLFTGCFEAFA